MIDRTELDLRFDAHARMASAMNGRGWKDTVVFPLPRPRAAIATLLTALATRLDPALAPRRRDSVAPLAPVPPG